jgi:hypothetical protein
VGVGTTDVVVPRAAELPVVFGRPVLVDDEQAFRARPAPSAPSALRSARRLIPDPSSSTPPV